MTTPTEPPHAPPLPQSHPAAAHTPSRRLWLRAAGASLAVLAAGGGYAYWQRRHTSSHTAGASAAAQDPLWDLTLPQPGGGVLALREWRGQPVIVNFWATWCAPCVEELPLLNAFHQREPDWTVVGIAVDTQDNVTRFVERFALAFPIGVAGAAGVRIAQELGNHSGGLPFTLVADRSGALRARKAGQLFEHDLEEWRKFA